MAVESKSGQILIPQCVKPDPSDVWRSSKKFRPDLSTPYAWRSRMGIFIITSDENNQNTEYAWLKGKVDGRDGCAVLIDKNERKAIGVAEPVFEGGIVIARPGGFSGQFIIRKIEKVDVRVLSEVHLKKPDKI